MSNLNNNLGVNSSSTFKYLMLFEKAGTLSSNLIIRDNLKRNIKRIIEETIDKNNKTSNQKKERPMMELSLECSVIIIKINPPHPIKNVIVSWHMLPAMDKETDLSLFPSFT